MITTEEARQILGNKYKSLSDNQIQLILSSLYRLSDKVIQAQIKKYESTSN